MKKFILFLLLLNLTDVYSESPDKVTNGLLVELKKFLPKEEFKLAKLDIPSKYSVNGSFYQIQSQKQLKVKYVYTGRVNTQRGKNQSSTQADYFDYIMLYSPDVTVHKVKITDFQSTHGEGVCSAGWLSQFVGYNGLKLLVVGKNVDAISGATISVNNLTFDVQSKTKLLLEIIK
jgi:hypothetical protein